MNEDFEEELLKDFPPYEIEELTKEEILGDTVMNYLVSLEDSADKVRAIEKVKEKTICLSENVVGVFNPSSLFFCL